MTGIDHHYRARIREFWRGRDPQLAQNRGVGISNRGPQFGGAPSGASDCTKVV